MHSGKKRKKLIHVVTLGCSKNLVDSEFLLRQITANGVEVRHNEESVAEGTVIINTCGFIQDAKQESIDTILRFIRAKQNGTLSDVFVMGCLSERYRTILEREIPEVDKYFGVNSLSDIISHLGLNLKHELLGERRLTTPNHYAYLKISEGCDRQCAFCAIPSIRGKHLSKSLDQLEAEAVSLSLQGVRELILIAQDLTWYGMDLYKRQALPDLLTRLSKVPDIHWIRLHYAYPSGFPVEILALMRELPNVCKYLDIPFQHSSTAILNRMQRGHTLESNLALIDTIRKSVPGIALRTSLMTGFPGETDADFDNLVQFVEKVRFDRLGIFTYSEEENTPAARKWKDDVPGHIKKERADMIMETQQDISASLNAEKIGKVVEAVVDAREGEFYVARTEADSPEVDQEVLIPASAGRLKTGNFYQIKITGSEAFDLYGKAEG